MGGKIKTEVVTSLSKMPIEIIATIENSLKHGLEVLVAAKDIVVKKAIDYGLVFLLVHLMDKLKINSILDKELLERAPLVKAMVVGKIVTNGSKLGIYNWIMRNPAISGKLGLDTQGLKVDDLYSALALVNNRQDAIEKRWFSHHCKSNGDNIFLYDLTSTYFEGTQNELALFGYNRDKKIGKMQINIGLITNSDGFPLKIEVFEGNVNDHKTVLGQVANLKNKLKAKNIIFVGDRGMKVKYNLDGLKEAEKEGVDYITGLTHMEIDELVRSNVIQLSLFGKELAEIEHEGIRYILSVNPELRDEETAYLNNLRSRVEKGLSAIQSSWEKRHLKNLENLAKLKEGNKNKKLATQFDDKKLDNYKISVSKLLAKKKATKYYETTEISNSMFKVSLNEKAYEHAIEMSGLYVVSSTVSSCNMDKEAVRETYRNLQNVEHAFRDFKSENIQLRPVFHRNEAQTRGHVFVSMLSYSLIKELEDKIFPFLKIWNKEKKQKISFNDVLEELRDIKLCILNIGTGTDEIKITELDELQTKILNLFGMKKSNLEI
jgi:transposase